MEIVDYSKVHDGWLPSIQVNMMATPNDTGFISAESVCTSFMDASFIEHNI